MNNQVNGFVICISTGEYSDRQEYYLVFPSEPDPQDLFKKIQSIHMKTKNEMKNKHYSSILSKTVSSFIASFDDAKDLPVVATFRNEDYNDSEWELIADND